MTLSKDEGPRPDTSAEGLASLKPVRGEGFTITAGNASQLSDGASASVIMSDKEASRRGLTPGPQATRLCGVGIAGRYAATGVSKAAMVTDELAVIAMLHQPRRTMPHVILWPQASHNVSGA